MKSRFGHDAQKNCPVFLSCMHSPWFWILLALILLRIWMGYIAGIQFYSRQMYDDALMVRYSDLAAHFHHPNLYSLVKTMSYPLFLNLVHLTHLDYGVVYSLVWVMTALYFGWTAWQMTGKKWLSLSALIYILFFPSAFEFWQGTRVYRNVLIAPSVLLIFSYMFWFTWTNMKQRIRWPDFVWAVLFGLVFTFGYYVKEDGIWLLACLIFFILVNLFILLLHWIRGRKNGEAGKRNRSFLPVLACLILPALAFSLLSFGYREVNRKYFGVAEVETRNGGSLGEFAAEIYRIDSPNRNSVNWAPKDAIDQAFEASETLSSYPGLYEAIIYTPWYGNIEKTPIKGDFLTWVLRTALEQTGMWNGEKEMQDLFAKVNQELDQAFEEGTLKEDQRIQILSSAGGRTAEEIRQLAPLALEGFAGAVALKGYEPAIDRVGGTQVPEVIPWAETVTNTDYLHDYSLKPRSRVYNILVRSLFFGYSVLNQALFALLLVVMVLSAASLLIRLFRRKKINARDRFLTGSVWFSLCLSVVFVFSVLWFAEFLFTDELSMVVLNFYLAAVPALLSFGYLFSVDYISETAKKIRSLPGSD